MQQMSLERWSNFSRDMLNDMNTGNSQPNEATSQISEEHRMGNQKQNPEKYIQCAACAKYQELLMC